MKKKMVGLLIAFVIVIGFTNQFVPATGGQIAPLSENGAGGL